VLLHLRLSYAVCEKLCVPAEAAARLHLARIASTHDTDLAAAEGRVPKSAEIGSGGPLVLQAVRRIDGGARPRIVADVAAPAGVPVDLFVEGPTPEWALPLPEPTDSSTPGSRQFSFELDGLPAGAQPQGAELTFTLVAGGAAIEVKARLD
jgi:DsbC/DsbD-like thiol-disulfide interchange protein